MIGQVIGPVVLPEGSEELIKYLCADHWNARQGISHQSARNPYEGLLATVLFAQRKNI